MDIEMYLERIGYVGPISPTVAVLNELQRLHLLHVPFENLDIHTNTKIDLGNLFDKIVNRRRGGFCYELNGLFYELLKQIGFDVKMLSARVYDDEKHYTPEFDHMALVVSIGDEHYLVDVGFGEFVLNPIKIAMDTEVNDPRGVFKIEAFDDEIVVNKKNGEGTFFPEYKFSQTERRLEEFYEMCIYHQTNPASHFMKNRICSLPTMNGRITLAGNTLKITENGTVNERLLNDEEYDEALLNYFGIKL
jgi:N-hydroxyarylamine O-acetyltransferase